MKTIYYVWRWEIDKDILSITTNDKNEKIRVVMIKQKDKKSNTTKLIKKVLPKNIHNSDELFLHNGGPDGYSETDISQFAGSLNKYNIVFFNGDNNTRIVNLRVELIQKLGDKYGKKCK